MSHLRWGLFLACGFVFVGCFSKGALDDQATALTLALKKNDRQAFDALVTPKVSQQIDAEKFATLAAAISGLGLLKERNMRGLQVNNSVATGQYLLVFDRGPVSLEMTLAPGGKVAAFNYDGEVLHQAADEGLAAKVSGLRVTAFAFLAADRAPNPRGNQVQKGERPLFSLELAGVTAKDGKHHIEVDLEVKNSQGQVIRQQPKYLDLTGKAETSPTMRIVADLDPVEPGKYEMALTLRDLNGDQMVHNRQAFEVTP